MLLACAGRVVWCVTPFHDDALAVRIGSDCQLACREQDRQQDGQQADTTFHCDEC
jgi:hypothetical protein